MKKLFAAVLSLALALSFRMKFWNVGGEGEFIAGAIMAAWVAFKFGDLPTPVVILMMSLSAALAQTASSDVGGFSVTLPDHFVEESVAASPDPDLCFWWHGNKLNVMAYTLYQGEVPLSDVFLTGDETEYGYVTIKKMDMLYYRFDDGPKVTISYNWMDRGNLVTLEFSFKASDESSVLKTVNSIIESISFSAGH